MTIKTNLVEKRSTDEEVREMMKENLRLIKEVHVMTKRIKKYVVWAQWMSVVKILMIVASVVLSIIYLPPIVASLFEQYKAILNTAINPTSAFDVNNIPADILKMIQNK